jgi:AraC family transcriptional regulator
MTPDARIVGVDMATGRRLPVGGESPRIASGDLWKGLRVEEVASPPGEYPEIAPANHIVWTTMGTSKLVETIAGARRSRWQVPPGTLNLSPAGLPVAGQWCHPAITVMVELAPRLVSAAAPSGGRVELRPAYGVDDPLLAQLVEALRDEARAGATAGGRLYVESLGIALAARLARKYAAAAPQPRDQHGALSASELRRVLEYIDAHLGTNLALGHLAEAARMHVFAFIRHFKQGTGVSPHQYVLRRRIERARSLLADTDLSIVEIALRCGFGDQSSFTTAFRRWTRLTPRGYRDTLS